MRHCLLLLLLLAAAGARRTGGGRHDTGTHSYPHSTGYSGAGTGGAHTYPQSSGAHTYPQSTGVSGNNPNRQNANTYNTNNYHNAPRNYNSRTEVHHHHYNYNPPSQISYGSTYHPVFHGPPPIYVYEYRNSGSRFDTLLTGLALYNLGRMSSGHHNYDSHREYSGTRGEICKLGISKQTGEYEETRIDCKLMSSFIWESQSTAPRNENKVVSTSSVTTTVTNVTNSGNGTAANNTVTTVTVKNETVTDALHVKGPSIQVTPGMTCYMIRISSFNNLKKNVDCALLQTYAQRSLHPNDSERLKPAAVTLLGFMIGLRTLFIIS